MGACVCAYTGPECRKQEIKSSDLLVFLPLQNGWVCQQTQNPNRRHIPNHHQTHAPATAPRGHVTAHTHRSAYSLHAGTWGYRRKRQGQSAEDNTLHRGQSHGYLVETDAHIICIKPKQSRMAQQKGFSFH